MAGTVGSIDPLALPSASCILTYATTLGCHWTERGFQMAQQRSLALEVGISVSGLDTFYSECGDGVGGSGPRKEERRKEGGKGMRNGQLLSPQSPSTSSSDTFGKNLLLVGLLIYPLLTVTPPHKKKEGCRRRERGTLHPQMVHKSPSGLRN